ncbi:hypothetical protein [Streptomyces sp. enrichment culture]|uniref:hypothetical protein n=1 Tax=Streptomyces sp. enrichment culture TaxID=1795815 RepID=UPI003F5699E0
MRFGATERGDGVNSKANPAKPANKHENSIDLMQIPVGVQVIHLPAAIASYLRSVEANSRPGLDATQVWITESGGALKMYFGDVDHIIGD